MAETRALAFQDLEPNSKHIGSAMAIPILLLLDLQQLQAMALAQSSKLNLVRLVKPMVVCPRQEPRAMLECQTASGLPIWSARPSIFIRRSGYQFDV